ncbi:Plant UBX domain-containing protein 1, variant 2 [Salvia divinorum]|uniref:Plant UBX domain-containing protein 1, variant 2 n=1 Tax=Salvia divinorum TaxID=28513 RepID=A0ABD1I8P1_SALDI
MIESSPSWKRRRFIAVSPMESELAKGKLAAAREKYGRDIRVFETSLASATPSNVSDMEETDDFYEFTAEDYFRVLASKKEDKHLKTKKIREAEEAARRSRITKAVIRVRFPDNFTLEASFHSSETIQTLIDLLTKVIARSDLPFYLYTTPPKKQIKDFSQDFYCAGFVPGAIVYFAYEVPKGDDGAYTGPSLQEEVVSLKGLEFVAQQAAPEPTPVEAAATSPSVIPEKTEQKRSEKKQVGKPKWLKM